MGFGRLYRRQGKAETKRHSSRVWQRRHWRITNEVGTRSDGLVGATTVQRKEEDNAKLSSQTWNMVAKQQDVRTGGIWMDVYIALCRVFRRAVTGGNEEEREETSFSVLLCSVLFLGMSRSDQGCKRREKDGVYSATGNVYSWLLHGLLMLVWNAVV